MTAPDPELKIQQRVTEAPNNTQEVVKSIGAYRVLDKVHTGYAGTIFRVSRREDGREFALKLLKQEFTRDEESMKRFLHEAGALSNLHHPNIVSICDSGITQKGGAPYIVTEWITGDSLKDVLKQGALSPERAAEIAFGLAQGLNAAHQIGIFHRDLQPGNVIIAGDGVARILDFGIAQVRPDGQRITRTGAVVGTSQYMSPEQYLGYSADARTDVYGLGCLLYAMLTGHSPFESDNIGTSMALSVGADRSFVMDGLRQVNCPAGLETIVMTMVARDADKRYQTMDEVCSALSSFEKGMPIARSIRMSKSAKRSALAVLVMLALVPLAYTLAGKYGDWLRSMEQAQQDHDRETQVSDRNPLTFEPPLHTHRHRLHSLDPRLHPGLTYLRDLESKILGQYGDSPGTNADSLQTTIRFRIDSMGAIQDIGVYKASGNAAADYSACMIIRRAEPFSPIRTSYYSEKLKETAGDVPNAPSLSAEGDAAVREADEQLRVFLHGDSLNEYTTERKSALIEVTLPPRGKDWLRLISVD